MEIPSEIYLKNFQSFGEDGACIRDAKRINVFVGPNNVGKSKILHVFDRLQDKERPPLIHKSQDNYEIVFSQEFGGAAALVNFPKNTGGGFISGNHWEAVGQHIEEYTCLLQLNENVKRIDRAKFIGVKDHHEADNKYAFDILNSRAGSVITNFPRKIFQSEKFFFIASERNVLPEGENYNVSISDDGKGVTALVEAFLHDHSKDDDFVRKYMLDDLNILLAPNFKITEIKAQKNSTKHWEIYLATENHKDIPLSQSGSGLKTAFQLLANVHLHLKAGPNNIENGLYLFEELENSLHPRMQRNVYRYLSEKFCGDSVLVFSTHSPIAIDFFQGNEEVSIYEVNQNEGLSTVRKVTAFNDRVGALDALGVKASSALQSNFVIWVEGPTDRIYLKRFLDLVSEGLVQENRDYVIMFYGGKLLSHLTLNEEDEVQELIRLLKINTKCAVLIDSDRSSEGTRIRGTKRRIGQEARANSLLCWVTKGREIENYISPKFWSDHFNITQKETGQFNKIFEAIKGKRTKQDKPIHTKIELAAYVDENISKADLVLDWESKSKELMDKILEASN